MYQVICCFSYRKRCASTGTAIRSSVKKFDNISTAAQKMSHTPCAQDIFITVYPSKNKFYTKENLLPTHGQSIKRYISCKDSSFSSCRIILFSKFIWNGFRRLIDFIHDKTESQFLPSNGYDGRFIARQSCSGANRHVKNLLIHACYCAAYERQQGINSVLSKNHALGLINNNKEHKTQ